MTRQGSVSRGVIPLQVVAQKPLQDGQVLFERLERRADPRKAVINPRGLPQLLPVVLITLPRSFGRLPLIGCPGIP